MPYCTFSITSIALVIALPHFLVLSLSDTLYTHWPSRGTLHTYLAPLSFILCTTAHGSIHATPHLARNHSVIAQVTSSIGIFYRFLLEPIEWSLYTYSRPTVVTGNPGKTWNTSMSRSRAELNVVWSTLQTAFELRQGCPLKVIASIEGIFQGPTQSMRSQGLLVFLEISVI